MYFIEQEWIHQNFRHSRRFPTFDRRYRASPKFLSHFLIVFILLHFLVPWSKFLHQYWRPGAEAFDQMFGQWGQSSFSLKNITFNLFFLVNQQKSSETQMSARSRKCRYGTKERSTQRKALKGILISNRWHLEQRSSSCTSGD